MTFITILSDFGLQDPSAAIVKGVFMQYTLNPIVEISHEVKPFHIRQAAYLLSAAYKNFPEGSCHVLLYDLFSETTPRLLLSEFKGHYFLFPDNGLLPLALGELPGHTSLVYELNTGSTFIDWLHRAGSIIKQLIENTVDLNLPTYTLKAATEIIPELKSNEIHCHVLHIDHYENVVLNINKRQFEKLVGTRPFQLQFMHVEEINEISSNYNAVREGYKLCRFNSNGYLEICINRGKAASLFGLRIGSKHNNIKIILE